MKVSSIDKVIHQITSLLFTSLLNYTFYVSWRSLHHSKDNQIRYNLRLKPPRDIDISLSRNCESQADEMKCKQAEIKEMTENQCVAHSLNPKICSTFVHSPPKFVLISVSPHHPILAYIPEYVEFYQHFKKNFPSLTEFKNFSPAIQPLTKISRFPTILILCP